MSSTPTFLVGMADKNKMVNLSHRQGAMAAASDEESSFNQSSEDLENEVERADHGEEEEEKFVDG